MEITIQNLCKDYEGPNGAIRVLDSINLQASDGDSIAVMGPSGSGKSTLLHILGVLDAPTSGEVHYDGQSPFALRERERALFRNKRVGFVFQDHHLLPQFSVLENTVIPALANRRISKSLRNRANELLEQVGLAHRIDHRPGELSGGERQRVAIARALINSPDVLLCDEPTGNLDMETATQVSDVLFDLHRNEQTILMMVTHSTELASRCASLYQLRVGKLDLAREATA